MNMEEWRHTRLHQSLLLLHTAHLCFDIEEFEGQTRNKRRGEEEKVSNTMEILLRACVLSRKRSVAE